MFLSEFAQRKIGLLQVVFKGHNKQSRLVVSRGEQVDVDNLELLFSTELQAILSIIVGSATCGWFKRNEK